VLNGAYDVRTGHRRFRRIVSADALRALRQDITDAALRLPTMIDPLQCTAAVVRRILLLAS
jgi:hypothetical protein